MDSNNATVHQTRANFSNVTYIRSTALPPVIRSKNRAPSASSLEVSGLSSLRIRRSSQYVLQGWPSTPAEISKCKRSKGVRSLSEHVMTVQFDVEHGWLFHYISCLVCCHATLNHYSKGAKALL